MRLLAWIFFAISMFVLFSGCAMDTSISSGMGGRVNNIGLLQQQSNTFMAGGVLFLTSVILFVASRKSAPNVATKPQNGSTLYQLCSMRESGVLNDSEFEAAKSRLLYASKEEE